MTSEDSDSIDMTQVKDAYKKVSQKRFKHYSNGYKGDRWLFQLTMFLIFGWLFFVAHAHDYKLDYYECIDPNPYYESGTTCKNPFYEPVTWKNQESLPPGNYGTKPGPLFQSVFYVPILFLAISALANHLIHNRRRRE